jgi:predicted nucleic-acid-binding protein
MIGLDTNVLVRFLVRDDATQAAQADALMATLSPRAPGFVAPVVLAELWWVLAGAYGRTPSECRQAIAALVESDDLVIGSPAAVRAAVEASATGADFADALITELGHGAGCTATATFDKAAAKRAGMTLVSELVLM